MRHILHWAWYVVPAVALGLAAWLAFTPTDAPGWFNRLLSAGALFVGYAAFIHGASERRRQAREDKPDLTADIRNIVVNKKMPGPQGNNHCLSLIMSLRNRGRHDAALVGCFLMPEGSSRDKALQLGLAMTPLTVPGGGMVDAYASWQGREAESPLDRGADLIFRDATDREYRVKLPKLIHGSYDTSLADLPVRKD